MKPLSLVKGHNEAVVDCQYRDVPFNELLDDVFAHLGIEAHQTQPCAAADQVADFWVSIFDGYQQLGQDIVREAVRIGCVVEFVSERLEQGLFIACVKAEQEQQLCDGSAVVRIVHAANRQLVRIITGVIPVIIPHHRIGEDDVER